MPIFLKVNHQLESRTREIRPFGSEGGAKLPSSLPLSINRRTSAKMALLSGQLGDLPLPWVTNRADLFQVPRTSHRAAVICEFYREDHQKKKRKCRKPPTGPRQFIGPRRCRIIRTLAPRWGVEVWKERFLAYKIIGICSVTLTENAVNCGRPV